MANEWIPFYRSLTQGDKRGISRSSRFVYCELSLLARSTGGIVRLPRGFKTDADALHDILGGNRSEIVRALTELTLVLNPADPEDEPMITLSGPNAARQICVTKHNAWVSTDKSTHRVQAHRARVNQVSSSTSDEEKRVSIVTVTEPDKRRGEETREEKKEIVVLSASPSATEHPARPLPRQPALLVVQEPSAPDPVREVFDYWLGQWRSRVGGKRAPFLSPIRSKNIRKRLDDGYTVADIKRAVDACWESTFHVEGGYTDIELICRNPEKLDGLLARLDVAAAPLNSETRLRTVAPPAPPADTLAEAEALAGLTAGERAPAGNAVPPEDALDLFATTGHRVRG